MNTKLDLASSLKTVKPVGGQQPTRALKNNLKARGSHQIGGASVRVASSPHGQTPARPLVPSHPCKSNSHLCKTGDILKVFPVKANPYYLEIIRVGKNILPV